MLITYFRLIKVYSFIHHSYIYMVHYSFLIYMVVCVDVWYCAIVIEKSMVMVLLNSSQVKVHVIVEFMSI